MFLPPNDGTKLASYYILIMLSYLSNIHLDFLKEYKPNVAYISIITYIDIVLLRKSDFCCCPILLLWCVSVCW